MLCSLLPLGRYPAAWRLVDFQLPEATTEGMATFGFALNPQKLRQARRREGRYLLRTNLCGREPAELWQFYILLVEIEAAFKNLKMTWLCGPFFTNWSIGLKRTSLWPSWPTVCT
jgi:hypothetical protein